MGFVNNIQVHQGGIKEINGYIEKCLVEVGNTIQVGDFIEVYGENSNEDFGQRTNLASESYCYPNYISKLDDETLAVIGSYGFMSGGLFIAICTVNSNNSIIIDNFYTNTDYDPINLKCKQLSSNKFIMYFYYNQAEYLWAFNINNKQPAFGTPITLSRLSSFYDFCVNNSEKITIAYSNTSGYVEFATYTINNLTITTGLRYTQSSQYGKPYQPLRGKIFVLDDSRTFFTWTEGSSNQMTLYATVLTESASAITQGSNRNIKTGLYYSSSSGGGDYSLEGLLIDSSHVLVCAGSVIYSTICEINGSTITPGAPCSLYDTTTPSAMMGAIRNLTLLDKKSFILFYSISQISYFSMQGFYAVKVKIKGTDLIIDSTSDLSSSSPGTFVTLPLTSSKLLIFSNSGEDLSLTYNYYTLKSEITAQNNSSTPNALAKTSGTERQEIEVYKPYYTYKKYNTTSTSVTVYVEQKESTYNEVLLGGWWGSYTINYTNSISINQSTGAISLNNPTSVSSSTLSSGSTILNNKYFTLSNDTSVIYFGSNTTNIQTNSFSSLVKYAAKVTTKKTTATETIRGTYIEDVKAKGLIYPEDGIYNGYWYVLNT